LVKPEVEPPTEGLAEGDVPLSEDVPPVEGVEPVEGPPGVEPLSVDVPDASTPPVSAIERPSRALPRSWTTGAACEAAGGKWKPLTHHCDRD
jgi:hypothetical protein